MSESLLASSYQQLCENLLAIRKSGEWRTQAATFEVYVKKRWSLSKTRAKLLCDFATFCSLARKEYLPVPDSPENIKPILDLAQKHWMDVWRLCRNYATGPVNAAHCQATLDHFGYIARKKLPAHVMNGRRVRKAAATMAAFEDGEKLADQIGADGFGKHWDQAVKVVVEADQFNWDERGGGKGPTG